MDQGLIDRYRRELDYLRALGAEFAAAHPDAAGRLGLPRQGATDPHVERLLEGTALLSARIRGKIEDEQPELTEALLDLLDPTLVTPIPAIAVVQFTVNPAMWTTLAAGPTLAAGEPLESQPKDDAPACGFRTAYPVRLWPLEPQAARLEPLRPGLIPGARGSHLLTISIRCLAQARLDRLDASFDSLRFYLDGAGVAPYTLRDRLLESAAWIEIAPLQPPSAPDQRAVAPDHRPIVLARGPDQARRVLTPVGFSPDHAVLPRDPRSSPAHANMREYFVFPQKFLFVDLAGLAPVRGWPGAAGFEIRVVLDLEPRDQLAVRGDSLRLYCTPAVNLFRRQCRVERDHRRLEYRVETPLGRGQTDADCLEIVSIDQVRSSRGVYWRGSQLADARESSLPAWFMRREQAIAGAGKQTTVWLSFVDALGGPVAPEDRSITVDAVCSNLDMPRRLPGDALELARSHPVSRTTPLTPFSSAIPPPPSGELHWRLIAALALDHLPIADPPPDPGRSQAAGPGADALRALVRLRDPVDAAATRRRHQAIRRVQASREFRALARDRRGVVGGVRVQIDFDPQAFEDHEFLFAEVLGDFLARHATINSFTRLVAAVDGKIVREWPPRSGENLLP